MKNAVYTWTLDGRGGGRPFAVEDRSKAEVLWFHLDYKDPVSVDWLQHQSGLHEVVVEALLADAPRPRCLVMGEGLLVIMRGINVNKGAEPEDMVSLRFWVEEGRVLTLRHRPVAAVQQVIAQLEAGKGPVDSGQLLHELIDQILKLIGETVEDIEDMADELEELVVTAENRAMRTRLAELRRVSIALRRHLAPQRESIGRLHTERVSWLSDLNRARLREEADRIARYIETLDSARERAAVTHEELSNRLAEQMNKTMYVLAVVAAIFLPLGLITGLLGINVGGIPGADSSWAFAAVTLSLVVLGVLQWLWYKRHSIL